MKKSKRLLAVALSLLMVFGCLTMAPTTAKAMDVSEMAAISNAQVRTPDGSVTYNVGDSVDLYIYAGFIVYGAYNWIQVEILKDGKPVYWNCYNYDETTTLYYVGSFTPTEPGTYTVNAGTTNSAVDANPDGGTIRKISGSSTFTIKSKALEVKPVKPKVTVTWSSKGKAKISCSNAGGYGMQIYRATSKSGKYKSIKKTAKSSYTNSGLSAKKTYYYKVRLYAKDGSKTYYSKYSAVKKLQPYAAAVKTVKPQISVSWSGKGKAKISCSNTGGYKMLIYRAASKSGKYKKIGTTTKSSYTNSGLADNKEYFYKVMLTSKAGKKTYKSKYSAVKKLGTYKAYKEEAASPPPSITDISYSSANGVKITWKKHPDAGFYLISRSTKKEGTYEVFDCVGSEDSVSYDTDVSSGQTYYYQVEAKKGDDDHVAISKPVSFKVP